VTFEAGDIPAAVGSGPDALTAALSALSRGKERLAEYRALGGDVLHEVQCFGLQPFRTALEDWSLPVLVAKLGMPLEQGTIVEGPIPKETGYVHFKIRVRDTAVSAFADRNGVGVETEVPEVHALAARAVHAFVRAEPDRALSLYLEAARLRREAGVASPFLARQRVRMAVEISQSRPGTVVFRTSVAATELRVIISADGSLMDDCDDWSSITSDDRAEAICAVLQYVLAHATEMESYGLDVNLFRELYS
jgi:hypothetical protein